MALLTALKRERTPVRDTRARRVRGASLDAAARPSVLALLCILYTYCRLHTGSSLKMLIKSNIVKIP